MADMLVTTTELAVYLDWADLTYPIDRPTQAIENATAMIQTYTGQRLIAVTNDTVVLRGGKTRLWLPQRPVTSVASILVDGVTYTNGAGTDWLLVGNELYVTWWWSRWPAWVTVTYSHGYTTMPQQIKWACLSVAARLIQNPGSLRQETVGGASQTWAGSAQDMGPGLNSTEKNALLPYRVPRV